MGDYSKYNIVYRLQKWMDSVPGQTFLNYAYSWGASIVIAGTLFKLTHLPGANLMLFLGMGTEIIVFFLSAFDRPFDKTADGREIPTHVTEEYLETGKVEYQDKNVAASSIVQPDALTEMQVASEEMQKVQSSYVDELKNLVDTLGKVNEQSSRLTRDSEEMENLNRTLTGITKVYEMQLKSASQQIGTIDQINEQTRKMAQQIEQLNSIYARMIAAMTANLKEK
nr:gliding motility protein GldL [uncultured Prevotella sp.]